MDWPARYRQQAVWTAQLRKYLYQRAGLSAAARVLEPGCGSGAALVDCPASQRHGLDWDFSILQAAKTFIPDAEFVQGNAESLPYASASFDACLTHYFLLWVNAIQVLEEMVRVTRPGGVIFALAEPDYAARVDAPETLAEIGRMQAGSLLKQGANITMGRQLAGMFARSGLKNIITGVLGGEWTQHFDQAAFDLEWEVIETDLAGRIDPQRLAELRQIDTRAWQHGERVLYVPTFYAMGWKSD